MEVVYKTKMKHGRPVMENGKKVEEETTRLRYPGYVMVSFEIDKPGWGILRDIDGVVCIMCTRGDNGGMVPRRLPMGFVEALQRQGRAGDGAIDERKPAFPILPIGTEGTITDGSLSGFTGRVTSGDAHRIWVEAEIFGRATPIELDRAAFRAL